MGAARTHLRWRAGRWPAVLGRALAVGALAAARARAADGVIDGSPLNVYANDVGRLQAAFDGAASGEFYTGALAPSDGGLTAAVASPASGVFTVYGRGGGLPFTAVSAPRPER